MKNNLTVDSFLGNELTMDLFKSRMQTFKSKSSSLYRWRDILCLNARQEWRHIQTDVLQDWNGACITSWEANILTHPIEILMDYENDYDCLGKISFFELIKIIIVWGNKKA